MGRTTAPETPTTKELLSKYTLTEYAIDNRTENRRRLRAINNRQSSDYFAVIGACTLTANLPLVAQDTLEVGLLNRRPGILPIVRAVPSKSRSFPDSPDPKKSYCGLETEGPEGAEAAMGILNSMANDSTGVGLAMEMQYDYHPPRYGHMQTLGWWGARADPDKAFAMASTFLEANPDASAGIKSDVNGNIENALELVDRLNSRFSDIGRVSFFIYRGGENARTPQQWEDEYRRVYDRTEGMFAVCFGHGTEQAHDPNLQFEKSVAGEIAAIEHGLYLAEVEQLRPMGGLFEASYQPSVVDPNAPLKVATSAAIRFAMAA